MRILHTSDWHIGRTFHGVDLLADQRRALDAIAGLVAEQDIDVVVVPGDSSKAPVWAGEPLTLTLRHS